MTKKGKKYCKEEDCKDHATTAGYCRLHYLETWVEEKKAQNNGDNDKMSIDELAHELLDQYPDEYIEEARNSGYDYEGLNGLSFDDELENLCERLGIGSEDLESLKKRLFSKD